jgi:hypothetical protein
MLITGLLALSPYPGCMGASTLGYTNYVCCDLIRVSLCIRRNEVRKIKCVPLDAP